MTEQIKQRIKYLVEHGGIADDPLAEVKRMARWALGMSATALVLHVIELVL
jgi:hypothetical protein